MKLLISLILFSLLISFNSNVFAKNIQSVPLCSSVVAAGKICYVTDLMQIYTAQIHYGEQYVNGLMYQIKNNSPLQNQFALDNIQFPVVISPDQKIYIEKGVDQLLAYYKLANDSHHQYKYYLRITKKFPINNFQLTMQQFWHWMNDAHIVSLEDQGTTNSANQFQINITMMKNDPYLSLSKWLAEAKWCYDSHQKDKLNNIEYIWADYFRSLANEGQLAVYQDPNPTTLTGQKARNIYINYIQRVGVCHVNVADKLPGFCQYDYGCSG